MHTPPDNVITEKNVIITNYAKTLHFMCAVNGPEIHLASVHANQDCIFQASRRSPNWPRPSRTSWTTRVQQWTSAPFLAPIPTETLRLLLSLSWFLACARDFTVTRTINNLTYCLCKDSQGTLFGVCRGYLVLSLHLLSESRSQLFVRLGLHRPVFVIRLGVCHRGFTSAPAPSL